MIGHESRWLKHDTVRRLHCQQHTVETLATIGLLKVFFFSKLLKLFRAEMVRTTDEVIHVNIIEVWSRLATHRKIYSSMWLNYFLDGHARLPKPDVTVATTSECWKILWNIPPRPMLLSKMCTIDWVRISNIEQGRGEIFQHK